HRRVPRADHRRQPRHQAQQGRFVRHHHAHHARRLRDGEVEIGPGHRVHRAQHVVDLVAPPRVPHPPVDGGVHLGARVGGARPPALLLELRPPPLHQLGHPVQHLPPVVRRPPPPPPQPPPRRPTPPPPLLPPTPTRPAHSL